MSRQCSVFLWTQQCESAPSMHLVVGIETTAYFFLGPLYTLRGFKFFIQTLVPKASEACHLPEQRNGLYCYFTSHSYPFTFMYLFFSQVKYFHKAARWVSHHLTCIVCMHHHVAMVLLLISSHAYSTTSVTKKTLNKDFMVMADNKNLCSMKSTNQISELCVLPLCTCFLLSNNTALCSHAISSAAPKCVVYLPLQYIFFPHFMRIVSWKGSFTWSSPQARATRKRAANPTGLNFSTAEPWMGSRYWRRKERYFFFLWFCKAWKIALTLISNNF